MHRLLSLQNPKKHHTNNERPDSFESQAPGQPSPRTARGKNKSKPDG
jgi:hypothetical protein